MADQALPPGKPPRLALVEMTELVLPNDANPLGNMLGGRVMLLIDICGSMAAARHANRICVTASMERLDFHYPIRIGQAIILRGQPIWSGRTSLEIAVDVFAEDLLTGDRRQTCSAILTFVAVDEAGQAVPVTPVRPETEEERRRWADAERRQVERKARRAAVADGTY